MGEVNGDFDGRLNVAGEEDGDDERVHEWEVGLPNVDDITPLTQGLIPLELLSAFNIKPEPYRTSVEVRQASEDTLCLLRGTNFKVFGDENDDESETKKQRRNDSPEDADSAAAAEVAADVAMEADAGGGCGGGEAGGGGGEKTVKRSRLVWTPQLHKRFVDVVGHLGIKNAVPKTIMQLMNVEGLTRENVASHLQKYRLYLKRMQGGSFDGGTNSSSEIGNGTGNGNGNGNGSGNGGMSASVPVMPMMGMDTGMMRMGNFNGFEGHHNQNQNHNHNQQHRNNHYNYHQYNNGNGMMMQPANKYGSFVSYHHPRHVGSGDN